MRELILGLLREELALAKEKTKLPRAPKELL